MDSPWFERGLDRMGGGKKLRRLNVGGGHETFGHRVGRGGFDPADPGPTVSLVGLDDPQFFILFHADATLACN